MGIPLRSILAATDLESGSDAIVRSAAILAARTGAELHLLHSLGLPAVPSDGTMRSAGFFAQLEWAQEALHAQAERTMPEGVRTASEKAIIYVAHKAILDRAREVSADLIVVGPHRGAEAGARFLGTTADRVIRTAEVPCLVVVKPLSERIRRIGVPLDCSDPSQGALEIALAWGLQLASGAEAGGAGAPGIRVMHVGWPVERDDDPQIEERTLRPQLERQVERAVAAVPGAESMDIGIEVLWENDPRDATARWAETAGIDLLVMGTHGRGGLERALIGSVASSVARHAPRPVLLVPPTLWSGHR